MNRRIRQQYAVQGMLAVCLTASLCACFSTTEKSVDKQTERYSVVHPKLLDTVYTREYVAEIQSVQNVEIRARVKGFIEKIHVDEGKPVKAGQVLFTLSNRTYGEDLLKANAQLKSARAELKAAEVDIKNVQLLAAQDIVSNTELETAQAKKEAIGARIEEAQSAIAIARINLSFTQVKAPFDGIINRIPNKVGSLVDDGILLTSISNSKEVFAYFNVSEKEYLDFVRQKELGKSQQVSLVLADGNPFPTAGTIETIESEINRGTGTLAFRARFRNPDALLKHGSSAKVLMSAHLKQALVVPQKSTFEVQDKVFVYVADANNKVQVKNVAVSLRLPHLYVVESGLSPDDRVIYEGVQLVKEGEKIVPELLPFREAMLSLSRQ